ncbi:glutamyl-tRNA reductase [Campylobacter majalis]|uniref:glutamyl-tRNA reductase n=1 Tax=Campylobacter majalis TaxID=2790656 RepID=UPI003D69ED79
MYHLNVSFTHKNTDISVREKLAFDTDEKKEQILRLIKANKNIKEAFVLSTCNRVEVLAYVDDTKQAQAHILRCMAISSGVFEDELFERADIYEDSGAIHHLFAVASSLDSLVVGETQIVGQLKSAFKYAYDAGFCADALNILVEGATKCAARVRNETQISKNPISVSSVAVAKAKDIFGSLENKKVLIVGAGEMCELAAKHLISNGANVLIINRSSQRVEALVDELGNKADWDTILKLKEYVNSYDLIFSGTSAPHAIINDSIVEKKDFKRYFFDIAVPRDINLNNHENIEVFSVDDLEEIVQKNLAMREEQANIAYKLVGQNTAEFLKQTRLNLSTPIIKAIRKQAKFVAKNELDKAIKKGYLKNCDKDEAYRFIDQVFRVFLHPITMQLKQMPELKNADEISKAMRLIFDIKDES